MKTDKNGFLSMHHLVCGTGSPEQIAAIINVTSTTGALTAVTPQLCCCEKQQMW